MSRRLVVTGGFATLIALLVSACQGSSEATSAAEAASTTGPLALRPGEVAELSVDDGVAGAVLATASADERYVVILSSAKYDTSGTKLDWSVEAGAPPPAGAKATIAGGCSLDPARWSTVTIPPVAPPVGTTVTAGATKTLHAWTPEGIEQIEVKAVAVGPRAVVWADVTAAHPAALDGAFASQFLADFENTILPRERAVFGVESDVDGDGHIGLVFTPLTRKTAVAFFTSCDLLKWSGCEETNAGEYLWLTPPNAIAPPYNTANAIKEILTHELAHLIHFDRKVLENQLTDWPDSGYMAEAVGGFAQDAIGPQSGNLYVAMAGLQKIADFSLGNTLADGAAYDTERDGALRGGSYLFFRWLYDRAGGDLALPDGTIEGRGGPALLRALLESRESIARTLPRVTERAIADIGTDFYTTLAMSNRDRVGGSAPTNPCFGYLPTQIDPITGKQRGADIFGSVHGMPMGGVAMTDARAGTVRAGGAAYVTLPGGAATRQSLRVSVDPAALPRVRIGRIK
jgi:hypothetical protein